MNSTSPASGYRDKLGGAPHSKLSLRLWLRILSCSTIVEKRVRVRLEKEFGTTLPRFDVLAALDRSPAGLTMGQLSKFIMVSNGNVTAVVNRLLDDGWLQRNPGKTDRRIATVKLTRKGRMAFLKIAATHEKWIDHMFGDLSDQQIEALMQALGTLRSSIEANGI